ncbi:GAF domain-containing protein [Gordonia sp. HY442]|uniref:GAF domain-containing sensor histidine kinase n=1 Tax=Gordonia zhenghanii TaxID=2911516 RepID=UPI001EFF84E8|nr:GAF domain-containing sensor histidine kinase [Gordonia zhenghanii]MCF8602756.1 GAF domain-containing protein [Gordonia zhenghanii]
MTGRRHFESRAVIEVRAAVDALAAKDGNDPTALRDVLEAVLLVGQGLELDAALQRIVEVAAAVLDAQYCALGVRGPELSLQAFVYTGIAPEQRAEMGPLPIGRGVLGELLHHPEVLRIPRLSDHPSSVGFPANHPPMDTFLGAPIIVRGELFGSIYLTEKQGALEFTELDETIVGVLAVAAGIAVDNARSYEGAQTRMRWMKLLADRGSEPLRGVSVDETLDGMCSDVAALTDAVDVYIVTGARLDAHTGDDVDITDLATVVETAGGVLSVRRFDHERSWLRRGARWATVQPVQSEPEEFRALVLTHTERRFWTAEEWAGMAGVARVASLSIAYSEQQELTGELTLLEERHRIARDLHDLVIQRLFAIGMSMQAMRSGVGDVDLDARMEHVVADLDATIAQIRTSIFDLQSLHGGKDMRTLRRRVLDVVSELAAYTAITPGVTFVGPVDTVVPDRLWPHIEAVLREGLSNALRHSSADRISVRIVAAEEVTVEVIDNGVGIPADVPRSGLLNLTRRADDCGGAFLVSSGAGGDGTRISWTAPLR